MKAMTKMGCPVRVSALFFLFFSVLSGHAGSAVTQRPLHIWFDTPCTLKGKAVWYGGRPEMWKGENKPESAGDTAKNPDEEWESASLPIGNGSLGANILGSMPQNVSP